MSFHQLMHTWDAEVTKGAGSPADTYKPSNTKGINAKRQSVDDLLLLYINRNGTMGNYEFIKYRAFFSFYVIIMFSEHTNNIHMKWLSTFSYTYIIGIFITFRGLFCSHSGNLCTCVFGDCLQNALSHLELLSRLREIETFSWLHGLCYIFNHPYYHLMQTMWVRAFSNAQFGSHPGSPMKFFLIPK